MWKIISIMWKDARLRFSSRAEWLYFLALPIVFMLILGRQSPTGGTRLIWLPVVDRDNSAASAALIARLAEGGVVNPDPLTADEAERLFARGNGVALLTIPAGLARAGDGASPAVVRLQMRANTTDALAVEQAVGGALAAQNRALVIAAEASAAAAERRPFANAAEQSAFFADVAEAADTALTAADRPLQVEQARARETAVTYNAATHQTLGQLITWVLIPLLGTSGVLAFERSSGTLRRLLTTPTRQATYLLGTIAGQYILALVQIALLVGFGAWIMGVDWGNPPGVALVLALFALAAVAAGVALGTAVRSESQASNISIMLGMVLALLGGCWFPIELFPRAALQFAGLLPTRWAMQALLDLSQRGAAVVDILPNAGALLALAAVCFGLGVWRFRYE